MPQRKNSGNHLTFSALVYRATSRIPRGRVATYAWIAKKIKNSRAARAVGNALNKNPYAPTVPCHRVIRSDGTLGGFARGANVKARMLKKEGVTIMGGMVGEKYILE